MTIIVTKSDLFLRTYLNITFERGSAVEDSDVGTTSGSFLLSELSLLFFKAFLRWRSKICGYKDDGGTYNKMFFDSRNPRQQRETDLFTT